VVSWTFLTSHARVHVLVAMTPGYACATSRPSLTPSDRLLAAADAYHAMTEPRPHRWIPTGPFGTCGPRSSPAGWTAPQWTPCFVVGGRCGSWNP
jgi:hypothetical protein